MKKFRFPGVVLIAFLSGNAVAAELSPPPPRVYPAPSSAAVPTFYTWTGCYIGANGGGIWAHRNWSSPVFGEFGSQTAAGGLGGLQGGCNYQAGAFVIGAQATWDWASATGNTSNLIFPSVTDQSQILSLGSVVARSGFAWDRVLIYANGGAAWLQSSLTLIANGAAGTNVNQIRSGWTVGIGGEYAFLDWLTGFFEYDYYTFNDSEALFCAPCGVLRFNPVAVELKTNAHLLRAGLNFRFGPPVRL
jgi:outer membrane immunogenic protein